MASYSTAASESVPDRGGLFDATYYATGCGPRAYTRNDEWLNFFGGIAAEIIRSLRPGRVFDAGCAMGMLVESFWDRGVPAWGADLSPYAISCVRADMRPYCRVASIAEPLGGRYDVVTCIEVLEHMPEGEARLAVGELTGMADVVLFSSTPDDFLEPTHINVHPILYWLKLFEEYGFTPDLIYDAGFVAPHAILFRRAQQPAGDGVLTLFAQKLRLAIALVEREQRIGMLNEQAANTTAALRDRELQLSQIADELRGAATARDAAEKEAAERTSRVLEVEGDLASAQRERDAARTELGDLRAELDLTRSQRAGLQHELDASRIELDGARKRIVESAGQLAAAEAGQTALRERHRELTETASQLTGELATIRQSPGWQLILRYRSWFHAARAHGTWIRRWYEPVASRLLDRLARGGSDETLPAARAAIPAGATDQTLLPYAQWILLNEPSTADLALQRRIAVEFAWRPKISVIVPVYRVPRSVLMETVESVVNQTYDCWELCIVHSDPDSAENRDYLNALAASDSRIRLKLLDANLGIAGNSNQAFSMSTGEFIALLDHDDTLAPFALFEMAARLNQDPSLDFIYSDKDQISESGERVDPLFKPGWSPDLVLSANYLTHLCVIRAERVRSIGAWRTETDGAQDWDLFLRAIQDPRRVAHIPKVLYHWRRIATSVAARGLEAKPYAAAAQLATVEAHLKREGWDATPAFTDSGLIQLRWNTGRHSRTSVIVVGNDAEEDVSAYAARVFARSHPGVELLLVPSDTNAPLAERLNDAVRKSGGELLVFLDQGVQIGAPSWLEEMIAPLQQPGIGITGVKLFDPQTHEIRQAGICFDADARLAYPFASETDYIHNAFGGANWYRNWLAVGGACFAIRRDVFDSAGGFSAQPVFPRLDVDLCLKVVLAGGRRVLYNPFARLWQTKPAALEKWLQPDGPAAGARYISSTFADGDPYFNPNLTLEKGRVALRRLGDARSPDHNYARESRLLVKAFDCTAADVEQSVLSCRSARSVTNHFLWFLPEFRHPFYGGVHTILRFADTFRRRHEIRSTFVVLGHADPSAFRQRIAAVSPDLAASSAVKVIDDCAALDKLEPSDAAIATLWSTAYFLLRYNRTREKFYFLQDHESLFYPAGSTSALVDATWDFGFKGLCNTVTIRDLYAARGGEAEFFAPSIDRDVFYPRRASGEAGDKPYTLFCYARPNHARNCFELLVEALRILKRRLGDRVTIVTAGEQWDPAQFGADGLLHNLGVLHYRATGALYRACDAGVIMMATAHPSYLPLELMACGSLVVTNENASTSWLLDNRVNCLLARTTPSGLAEAVEEGLCDKSLRRRLTSTASRMIEEQFQDWDGAAEKTFRYMERCLNRAGDRTPGSQLRAGAP